MRVPSLVLMLAVLFLAGCGSTTNWFSGDAPDDATLEPIEGTNPLIPERTGIFDTRYTPEPYLGTPMATITDLRIERIPGGVVIRATGRTGGVGAFNARLTPVNADEAPVEGVLTYRLEAQYTRGAAGASVVTVARQLTDQELAGTRTIRVEGLENALERRR